MARVLRDGLYIRLAETDYFAQRRRLGSTDVKNLWLNKEGWWWSSDLNKDKPPEQDDGEAQNFGHALHKITLEGDKAYAKSFVIAPHKGDYAGLCTTKDEILAALRKREIWSVKDSAPKAAVISEARLRAPDIPIWDVIQEKFDKVRGKRGAVSRLEDRHLRLMAEAVRADPEIGELFRFSDNHLPLAEVSVLWTDEFGIKHRDRLDLMIPTVTIDLKSLRSFDASEDLDWAVPREAKKRGYDVQMAKHHLARAMAYRFIREGKVYGATKKERAWLSRFPDEAPNYSYCWLFYLKPDATRGHAPILYPWWENHGDDLHRRALRKVYAALDLYRRCMKQFGPDKPWTRVERLRTSTEGSPDRAFLPQDIAGDALPRLPNEEELLAL